MQTAKIPSPETLDTRSRLLEAAHTLIWESSYGGVSVEDICKRAGVNKGSFYHFFPSKTDLAATALLEHWETIKPVLDSIFAKHHTPAERIKQFARMVYERQKEKFEQTGRVCGCPYASLGCEISGQDEKLRSVIEAMMEKGIGYFESCLQDAATSGAIDSRRIKEKAKEMDAFFVGILTTARVRNSLDLIQHDLQSGLLRISGLK